MEDATAKPGWNRGRPKRSLGQNFLVDGNIARKIVACLKLTAGDRVLEIGPGRGILTEQLLLDGAESFVLEKDLGLAMGLKSTWPELKLVAGDALRFDWPRLSRLGPIAIVGNLPYNIASPLIWDLAKSQAGSTRMVFTVQKEVAERLAADPGSKRYGGLSVWVQSYARVRLEFTVGPQVFRPRPKVQSAVVSLRRKDQASCPEQPEALRQLIRHCFQNRRKQLGTILKGSWSPAIHDWLTSQGLGPSSRPEELSADQFNSLSLLMKKW